MVLNVFLEGVSFHPLLMIGLAVFLRRFVTQRLFSVSHDASVLVERFVPSVSTASPVMLQSLWRDLYPASLQRLPWCFSPCGEICTQRVYSVSHDASVFVERFLTWCLFSVSRDASVFVERFPTWCLFTVSHDASVFVERFVTQSLFPWCLQIHLSSRFLLNPLVNTSYLLQRPCSVW